MIDAKQYRAAMRKWATGKATQKEILDCLRFQRHREYTKAERARQATHIVEDIAVASARLLEALERAKSSGLPVARLRSLCASAGSMHRVFLKLAP